MELTRGAWLAGSALVVLDLQEDPARPDTVPLRIDHHREGPGEVRASQNGRAFVNVGPSEWLLEIDVETGEQRRREDAVSTPGRAMERSRDGRWIVSRFNDNPVHGQSAFQLYDADADTFGAATQARCGHGTCEGVFSVGTNDWFATSSTLFDSSVRQVLTYSTLGSPWSPSPYPPDPTPVVALEDDAAHIFQVAAFHVLRSPPSRERS